MSIDPKFAKRTLRQQVRSAIAALPPEDRAAQEAMLRQDFASLPGLAGARRVLLYVAAFAEEIATRPLLDQVRAQGQRLLLPQVDRAGKRLVLLEVDHPGRDLRLSPGGIPEPEPHCPEVEPAAVDWVLVPGLAFDRQRFRLGRGGGYYDRLLPRLRPDCPRWALALEPQLVDRVPTEPHDQPLDGVALPGRGAQVDVERPAAG